MFAIFKQPGDNSKGKTSLDISTFFNFFPVSLFTITIILRIFFFLLTFFNFSSHSILTFCNGLHNIKPSGQMSVLFLLNYQQHYSFSDMFFGLPEFRLLCLLYLFINSYSLRPLNLRLSRPKYSKISFLHRGWLGNVFLGHALNH